MVLGAVGYGPGEDTEEGEGGNVEEPAGNQLEPVETAALGARVLGGGGHASYGRAAGKTRAQLYSLFFLLLLKQ